MTSHALDKDISTLVTGFVRDVTSLARRALKDTMERALGELGEPTPARTSRSTPPATAATGAARAKGAKRPKGEIAAVKARVLENIQANPLGQRIEQINKTLGTRTADLTLPLKQLIAEAAITTVGEKRATQYLPASAKVEKAKRSRSKKRTR